MDVFCFDFDGVICNSAPETAFTAWQGCRRLWPGHGGDWSEALQQRFCRLRPVIHTGYEAIPLMRMILDGDVPDAAVLADFEALRDRLMAREQVSTERLLQIFGAVRDELIAQDEAQWLRWNPPYPGLRGILVSAMARAALFVITTKQERFAALLLSHYGVELPGERLFGLERKKSKPEVLAALMARPDLSGGVFHFIEDRLETLEEVLEAPALAAVRLYLADWGYNTPAQRAQAAREPRIQVVSREAFRELHGLGGGEG